LIAPLYHLTLTNFRHLFVTASKVPEVNTKLVTNTAGRYLVKTHSLLSHRWRKPKLFYLLLCFIGLESDLRLPFESLMLHSTIHCHQPNPFIS